MAYNITLLIIGVVKFKKQKKKELKIFLSFQMYILNIFM